MSISRPPSAVLCALKRATNEGHLRVYRCTGVARVWCLMRWRWSCVTKVVQILLVTGNHNRLTVAVPEFVQPNATLPLRLHSLAHFRLYGDHPAIPLSPPQHLNCIYTLSLVSCPLVRLL